MHEGRYSAPERERFLTIARERSAAGKGQELMPPECTVGLLRQPVSSASYIDRFDDPPTCDVMDLYGRGSERAFAALRDVAVPILALWGTVSETVAPEALGEAFATLERAALATPSFESYVLHGANHFYSGRGQEVAETTLSWLNKVLTPATVVLGDDANPPR